ncbi:hypothetical protein EVAR_21576_1 [Eumeta japonica]|uniref:Uncharacterized protein n=1 Tax=Eumeta variegata TaxID=151549 RepID=A0A4C1UXF4_EUMVA|nr:hypothetical protein EVAR_21576_1 [Eumeta japonica]
MSPPARLHPSDVYVCDRLTQQAFICRRTSSRSRVFPMAGDGSAVKALSSNPKCGAFRSVHTLISGYNKVSFSTSRGYFRECSQSPNVETT